MVNLGELHRARRLARRAVRATAASALPATAGSIIVVAVNPVLRPRAEDLRLAPRHRRLERVAAEEGLVLLLARPAAQDDVAPGAGDVLVKVRFDVTGESPQQLERRKKTL